MKAEEIQFLTQEIEKVLGYRVYSPTEFEHLSQLIFHRTREHVSVSTLKRIWGYVKGYDNTRISTLNLLCRFLGYRDMSHFIESSHDAQVPSKLCLGRFIYADELRNGDILRLTWAPGRVCDVCYNGNGEFRVVDSQLTKLVPESRFCCHVIEQGEPMYVSKLRFPSSPQEELNYVAGLNGGVTFESLS